MSEVFCSISDVLSTLGNLFVAVAAVAGAMAAWVGLNTWKSQSIWATDNDLAKRSLMALYGFRDSLFNVRHPMMSSAELISRGRPKRNICER